MPQTVLRHLLGLCLVFFSATPLTAQFNLTPSGGGRVAAKVQASLIPEVKIAAPGQPFQVAVKLEHDANWHTYGKVLPPDVIGKPTTLKWTLPEGWSVEELPWPDTHEVPSTGGKTSQGYDGIVYLPAKITPKGKAGDVADIKVKLDALVCDPQNCMPVRPEVTLTVTLGDSAQLDTEVTEIFAKTAQPTVPASAPTAAPEASPATAEKATEPAAKTSEQPQAEKPAEIVKEKVSEAVPATVSPKESFGTLLLFAFIGGLILNIMPCVFPVLGIKVMGIVQQAGGNKREVVLHGLAYTAGVLVCFWLLGGLVVSLGKAWGFQLQSASFIYGLGAFFLIFGLNMAGVFEMGTSAVGVGANLQAKHGFGGSFFSGLLATIVATPCAAPYLGTALASAVTLPPAQGMTLFTMIGLGLASPFLLLSLFPKLISSLPRPGAWMESFKQGMSFLLFGTVAYMLWILTGMVEGLPMLFLFFGLVLVAFGCWIYGRWSLPHKPQKTRVIAMVLTIAFVGGGLAFGWPKTNASSGGKAVQIAGKPLEGGMEWHDWSPEIVAELRAAKKAVYIDYTAKWCFTCQVNKRVYNDAALQQLINDKKVVLLKADWTNEDPRITKALAELDKAAVPVNVLYTPGKEAPEILPELLSVENVSEAFKKL